MFSLRFCCCCCCRLKWDQTWSFWADCLTAHIAVAHVSIMTDLLGCRRSSAGEDACWLSRRNWWRCWCSPSSPSRDDADAAAAAGWWKRLLSDRPFPCRPVDANNKFVVSRENCTENWLRISPWPAYREIPTKRCCCWRFRVGSLQLCARRHCWCFRWPMIRNFWVSIRR